MPGIFTPPPEPLLAFRRLDAALADELRDVDAAHARYHERKDAGRIPANSVEALRVELTYHSNAIEGNTLSLRETQLVLEGYAPTSGKTLREVYEARNHDRALRMIEERADEPARPFLTEQDILDIHAVVLADIDLDSAGRYRTDRVRIKGTRFIPSGSHKFDELIPRMLDLANQPDEHPALQTAELHYNFVAVHPFNDGNGRTARLLMNGHLLRHGYPHTIIEVERRAEYLSALEEANAGRPARFAAFILRSVERSIDWLIGDD